MDQETKLRERILSLTLEIIYLLAGEDYTLIKKTYNHVTPSNHSQESQGWRGSRNSMMETPSYCSIRDRNKEKKILEVTHKIIELLTGEVAIRCQDVAVYLSMEEREYLEGHCDLYKTAMIEDQPPFTSLELCDTRGSQRNGRAEEKKERHKEIKEEGFPAESDRDFGGTRETKRIVSFKTQDRFVKVKEEAHLPIVTSTGERHGRYNMEEHPVTSLEDETGNMTPTPFTLYARPEDLIADHFRRGGRCSNLSPLVSGHPACTRNELLHGSLKADRRTPTGEKPYSCSVCAKCFSHTSSLTRHVIVHTAERPFSCSECGKCFNQKANLISHQKTHTGVRPHACARCGKCFSRRNQLVIHQRIHTGEKPYWCGHCGKRFTERRYLLSHRKAHM